MTKDLHGLVLCDAHMHLGTEEEWEERKRHGIFSMVCGSTPAEAERILSKIRGEIGEAAGISGTSETSKVSKVSKASGPGFLPSFGLHPWHAADWEVADMSRYFSRCSVIGEIGMDSVWCQVPLDTQERVFRQQLSIASELKKPVILHTKGEEERIARIIQEYPNQYLVHWYSCEEHLEEYLKLDCYFSIGPDIWWNPAVQTVARKAPLDRLLLETDGMNAVKWAYEEAPSCPARDQDGQKQERTEISSRLSQFQHPMVPKSAKAALTATLEATAKLRNLPPEELSRQVYKNLTAGFLKSPEQ